MAVSQIDNNGVNLGQLGNRNLIVNSAMQVAQRGTSSTSNGYVSLDRWYVNQSGASTTFSQETNSNPSETDGLQKYARLNVSTSSDNAGIQQRIEDVTSVPSGTVTISFYAKGTAPTGGLYVYGTQDFGTSGSSDVDLTAVQVTSSLTSSWVRYTAQLTIPSVDGKTINAGNFLVISIGQYSNTGTTAYDLNITGVQLEVGDTATPFEHRSYGDELARCKRYFERFDYDNTQFVTIGSANAATTANAVFSYSEKRDDPTITLPSAGQSGGALSYLTSTGGYPSTTGTNSIQLPSRTLARIHGSGYVGLDAGSPTGLFTSGASSILIDAEL